MSFTSTDANAVPEGFHRETVSSSPGIEGGSFRGYGAFLVDLLRSYGPLTKPTISLLVVFTAIPELLVFDPNIVGERSRWSVAFWALLGTFLASSSSAVFNHMIDADIDFTMQRTRHRPVPSGLVTQRGALWFGGLLGILSILILYYGASPLAAALGLGANIYYAWFYTKVLKHRTDQNIVIGGAAGAVGPLIGCAALSDTITASAVIQFLIIFTWTPPHFWALALKYQADYRLAQIPMLPVTRGDEVTRRHMLYYTLGLMPIVLSLWYLGEAGWIYGIVSFIATGYFCWKAISLYRAHSNKQAMSLFIYSCFYLFIIFGALALDRGLTRIL